MELLEERFPEPPLLPVDPAERALARLAVWRFDDEFSRDYYAARRGESRERFDAALARLDARLSGSPFLAGQHYTLADIAWYPWLPRAEAYLGVQLEGYGAIAAWLERLAERPAIKAELDIVSALAA
jgi:glutathione S-transferase